MHVMLSLRKKLYATLSRVCKGNIWFVHTFTGVSVLVVLQAKCSQSLVCQCLLIVFLQVCFACIKYTDFLSYNRQLCIVSVMESICFIYIFAGVSVLVVVLTKYRQNLVYEYSMIVFFINLFCLHKVHCFLCHNRQLCLVSIMETICFIYTFAGVSVVVVALAKCSQNLVCEYSINVFLRIRFISIKNT